MNGAKVFGPIEDFPVIDGQITVGGVPVSQLAARVGQTPFFAYDRWLVARRIEELRTHLPEQIELHYAIKANPMPAMVDFIAPLVDGLDVASGGELRVALDSGMEPSEISFAGPGKTDQELNMAVASGVIINMESAAEMARIAAIGDSLGLRPRVAIRVNPDFELKSSGMKMGGGAKQFGVDAEKTPQMLRDLAALDLEFIGFHIFAGSQNLREDALLDTQTKTIELAISLARHAPDGVRLVNLGGGFGIPYFPGEKRLDLAQVGQGLASLMPRAAEGLPGTRLMIELGRFIVGEAGVYVAKVIERKESRGEVFLITDGGLHHQLSASGNFGQVIRKNYPVVLGTRMGEAATESANIVGCLCTPLDRLGDKIATPRGAPGDLIVLFQSGAYGLTASPTAFLSHPAPVEVLI